MQSQHLTHKADRRIRIRQEPRLPRDSKHQLGLICTADLFVLASHNVGTSNLRPFREEKRIRKTNTSLDKRQVPNVNRREIGRSLPAKTAALNQKWLTLRKEQQCQSIRDRLGLLSHA